MLNFVIFASVNSIIMGRVFEYRKSFKMARWDKMAKTFPKIGKDIAIAVKLVHSDPDS